MSGSPQEVQVPRTEMIDIATRILEAGGTPFEFASSVAHSLVGAQEAGHASHGVIRLIEYRSFITKGTVIADARPAIARIKGATSSIDGNWGWGQVACKLALNLAREHTSEFGTFTVTIKNVNHIGRLGEYVEALADDGLVSMMWCNSDPSVAAFGGSERLFGTNPFAVGIPNKPSSIVIDFATAASAEGKLRVARANGQSIPHGIVIDKNGVESNDPNAFYEGGALLPFGGHKGYCMSLMVELLGGALSGGHPATSPRYLRGNGTVLYVIDPQFFVAEEDFLSDISDSSLRIKGTKPVSAANPVLLPGDVENAARAKNEKGIWISEAIWKSVTELLN